MATVPGFLFYKMRSHQSHGPFRVLSGEPREIARDIINMY